MQASPVTPNQELHQALVDQAPDAIILANASGAITIWNHAAEMLFGHTAGEALGASLDIIIPERLREAHWAGYQQAIENGRTKYGGRAMTTRATHKDGSKVYVDMSFGLVRGADGRILGALAIARLNTTRNAS